MIKSSDIFVYHVLSMATFDGMSSWSSFQCSHPEVWDYQLLQAKAHWPRILKKKWSGWLANHRFLQTMYFSAFTFNFRSCAFLLWKAPGVSDWFAQTVVPPWVMSLSFDHHPIWLCPRTNHHLTGFWTLLNNEYGSIHRDPIWAFELARTLGKQDKSDEQSGAQEEEEEEEKQQKEEQKESGNKTKKKKENKTCRGWGRGLLKP